jgi:hypothetical protein
MQESLPSDGGTLDLTVAADLLHMAAQDQAMRRQHMHDRTAWIAWEAVDRAHQRRLGDILDCWGWPTIALVGAEASQAAWLLAQHAPDLAFMERCLELMQHLPAESINPAHIAYLQDRVLMRRGEPQVYGTQFVGSVGDLCVHPIADPDQLDERRAAVGLGPFAAYEALLRGEHRA